MLPGREYKTEEARGKSRALHSILRGTIDTKPLVGNISTHELAEYFGNNRGAIPDEDGFYKFWGSGTPIEGRIVRIGSFEGSRTFWYPAKLEHLRGSLGLASHTIDVDFSVQAGLAFRQGEVPEAATIRPDRLERASWVYGDQKGQEALARVRLVDFGSGTGDMPILAAMFGTPSMGIEIDPELSEMARENKVQASNGGLLKAETKLIKGSFFDEELLKKVLGPKNNQDILVCYMSLIPITWKLLPFLIPKLNQGNYLLVYKEALSQDPRFPTVQDKLEVKLERPSGPFLRDDEPPISI